MKIKLIKPYSIWTEKFHNDCYAIFHWENGMWKEFIGGLVGISDNTMFNLLQNGYAIKTQKL